MRRRGFTLIEVLAALVVITLVMTLGVVVGRRWVQEQRELAFFQRVVTEWNTMMVDAENEYDFYTMDITQKPGSACQATFKANVDKTRHQITVNAPDTLSILGNNASVERDSEKNFTQPKTIMLESKTGAVYKLVLELGWGRLKFLKNDVLVE